MASSRAGELYGLQILERDIQDDQHNFTCVRCGAVWRHHRCSRAVRSDSRFIALSREPLPPASAVTPGDSWKTSIVFSLSEGPGVLFKALACFSLRGIDLTKIERCELEASRSAVWHADAPPSSRPMRSDPISIVMPAEGEKANASVSLLRFSYLFYVDLAASTADVNTQNALRHLQEMAPFMRVLGCYQMATQTQ